MSWETSKLQGQTKCPNCGGELALRKRADQMPVLRCRVLVTALIAALAERSVTIDSWRKKKTRGFLSSIPGYSGYRDKENRRDADKSVRDRIVSELKARADRVGALATSLANAAHHRGRPGQRSADTDSHAI